MNKLLLPFGIQYILVNSDTQPSYSKLQQQNTGGHINKKSRVFSSLKAYLDSKI